MSGRLIVGHRHFVVTVGDTVAVHREDLTAAGHALGMQFCGAEGAQAGAANHRHAIRRQVQDLLLPER
nr:hypothetical protein [Nonomuraea sp. SBT364]